ncbi:hypothetical protein JCM8547_002523 [Rhodosporidiobolus lusitaniae]
MPDLPLELLDTIFLFSIPPRSAYSAYSERQACLREYCLVSKSWRAAAQPLLNQVVRSEAFYEPLTAALPRIACDVRVVQTGYALPGLKLAVKLATTTDQPLEIRSEHESHLKSFANLSFLTLGNARLSSYLPVFPNLIGLTLHLFDFERSASSLSPSSFPHLSAVYITGYKTLPSIGQPSVQPEVDKLKNQLDSAQFRFEDFRRFPQWVKDGKTNASLLLLVNLKHLVKRPFGADTPFRHLQLASCPELASSPPLAHGFQTSHQSGALTEHTLLKALDNLADTVSAHTGLLSLSIPFHLHPSTPISSPYASARDKILNECKKHGIKVIWRMGEGGGRQRRGQSRVLGVCEEGEGEDS